MVRKIYDQVFTDGTHYVKAAGLASDSKPTAGLITGSHFVEVDTGKEYLYDEVSHNWHEIEKGYIAPV